MKNFNYTIHEHDAKKAGKHFDIRLQKGNEIHSFALPKSTIPDINSVVLAIKTSVSRTDGPLRYQGTIPDGQYGAGLIKIIEQGTYEILEWTSDSSKIIIFFPQQTGGQYLTGRYYLIKTSKENNYIFGKSKN